LRRAVAVATHVRLRSILLTSGTTVVGLAPLLIKHSWVKEFLGWFGLKVPAFVEEIMGTAQQAGGKDIWENLALSSIGGLISSTILLLIALPPLYYLSVRFGWIVRRAWGALRRWLHRAHPTTPTVAPSGD